MWQVKRFARLFVRKVRGSGLYRHSLFATDVLASKFPRTRRADHVTGTLVLCPPGGGNIGDQAMVQAIVEQVDGPVTLVVQREDSFVELVSGRGFVRVEVLPAFIRVDPPFRFAGAVRFSRLLHQASALIVVGADLMDGSYNITASLARVSALNLAARSGIEARVVGFSYSGAPERTLTSALRSLKGGPALFARDPVSYTRLVRHKVRNVTLSADVVFTSKGRTSPADVVIPSPRSFAVVNASGLIASRYSKQIDEYRFVFDAIRERGIQSIVVLPHVLSDDSRSDLPICRELLARFGTTSDVLVARTLEPSEVRGLVANAEFVVTGRMHLAVMALSGAVPAWALGTQGKVEGLFEHFGLAPFAVSPRPGFGSEIGLQIRTADLDSVRVQIRSALPRVEELSALNLSK